jgi:hypothetical protein
MSKGTEVLTVAELEKYQCEEYLSEKYRGGFYHARSFLQLVLPVGDAYIGEDRTFLVIGHAGSDGIEFCYRLGIQGIWAYYPIDQDFELKANTIQDLVAGWCSDSITL